MLAGRATIEAGQGGSPDCKGKLASVGSSSTGRLQSRLKRSLHLADQAGCRPCPRYLAHKLPRTARSSTPASVQRSRSLSPWPTVQRSGHRDVARWQRECAVFERAGGQLCTAIASGCANPAGSETPAPPGSSVAPARLRAQEGRELPIQQRPPVGADQQSCGHQLCKLCGGSDSYRR